MRARVVAHVAAGKRRVAWCMRRIWLVVATALAFGGASAAAPTCTGLVASLPIALDTAVEVVVAVTIEQGGRELAYERSHVVRDREGARTTIVLERRGLRRPEGPAATGGGDGAFALPCDDHDLVVEPDGAILLTLRDASPDAPVATWTLRFEMVDGALRPRALDAPFSVRVLFVPVRGRFATEFTGWVFGFD